MYIGTLPAASNRATYAHDFQLYDDEDDMGVDLAGALITLEFRRPGCATAAITATTANGRIVVTEPDDGRFALTIDVDAMRGLDPVTHECGITIEQNGQTTQFFAGTIPIIDGIVS